MNKRVTAIGLTAGLLAGGAAGLILEMTGHAGASGNRSTNVLAGADNGNTGNAGIGSNGVLPIQGTQQQLQSVLQPLVDDGTLTQEQADKVIAALEAADLGGMGGGMGGGMPGDGDGDHGQGGPGAGMFGGLDSVATLLGISNADVVSALQGGQTLAQLAEAHGTTAQDVIDVLVAAVKAHFDAEVATGEHTQADADARIAEATQQITDFVNNGGGLMPGGDGDRRHHGDGQGDGQGVPGMPGNDGATSTTSA